MIGRGILRFIPSLLLSLCCLFMIQTPVLAGDALLTKGWDMHGEPLSFGQVTWSVSGGSGANNFKVAFQLSGSKPNYNFTVGLHLFNPANLTTRPNMTGFGGLPLVVEGVIARDGKSAYAIAYDFGGLRTNAGGDGVAEFNLPLAPGTYYAQFTARIGAMNTCRPSQGITHGCAVLYRTGNRFAERFETITVASQSVNPPPQAEGRQENFAVKMVQMSADGNVFFKVANPDGSVNHESPVVSEVQPQIAQGFLQILLQTLETGKKVKFTSTASEEIPTAASGGSSIISSSGMATLMLSMLPSFSPGSNPSSMIQNGISWPSSCIVCSLSEGFSETEDSLTAKVE